MDSVNLGSPTSTSHLVGPASGMASAAASGNLSTTGSNKYSRLPNESDSPGHAAGGGGSGAFGRAMQQQQQLVRDQVESFAFHIFIFCTGSSDYEVRRMIGNLNPPLVHIFETILKGNLPSPMFMPTMSLIMMTLLRISLSPQNEQLGAMTDSVGNLRNISRQIGSELDEQAVMLDEFGAEIENAETKLDATMRKMAKVLHMSNGKLSKNIQGKKVLDRACKVFHLLFAP